MMLDLLAGTTTRGRSCAASWPRWQLRPWSTCSLPTCRTLAQRSHFQGRDDLDDGSGLGEGFSVEQLFGFFHEHDPLAAVDLHFPQLTFTFSRRDLRTSLTLDVGE